MVMLCSVPFSPFRFLMLTVCFLTFFRISNNLESSSCLGSRSRFFLLGLFIVCVLSCWVDLSLTTCFVSSLFSYSLGISNSWYVTLVFVHLRIPILIVLVSFLSPFRSHCISCSGVGCLYCRMYVSHCSSVIDSLPLLLSGSVLSIGNSVAK